MIHDELSIATTLQSAGLCPVELHALERAAIRNALRHAEGNRTHAARSLGISVRTLQRNIKAWMTQEDGVNGHRDGHDNGDGHVDGRGAHPAYTGKTFSGDGQTGGDGGNRRDGEGDVFLAMIGGRRIECRTVEDAVAIKTADVLIRNGGATSTLAELPRLIEVVRRYGCADATERLSQCLVRQRAAEFLTRSAGYQHPAGVASK